MKIKQIYKGGQYWDLYDKMPCGWVEYKNCLATPNGYICICNNKSRLSGERKYGLIKLEVTP